MSNHYTIQIGKFKIVFTETMDKDEWTEMDIDDEDKSEDIKYICYELIIEHKESKIDNILKHYQTFIKVFSGLKPKEVTFTGFKADLLKDIYTFDNEQEDKLMSLVKVLAYNSINISGENSLKSLADSEKYIHKTLESLTIAQCDDDFHNEFLKISEVYKFLKVLGIKDTVGDDNNQIRKDFGCDNSDLIIIRS